MKSIFTKVLSILVACLLVGLIAGIAQDRSKVIYTQRVQRDDKYFYFHFLRDRRGRVILTDDSLIFKTKNPSTSFFNFAFGYCEIETIRTWYGAILLPNRIRIKTRNSGAVRLFTYKRRNIIRLTREKMAACKREA